MPTILITGSEGNIGRYLVDRIKTRRPDWTIVRVKHASTAPRFNAQKDWYEGDLRDNALLSLIAGEHPLDYVLHAASMSYRHGGYRQFPYDVLENDSRVLTKILEFCKGVKKIVHLSSGIVYENATRFPLEEQMSELPAPTSSYGAAKYFCEAAVRLFENQHGVKYTIWRPFNVVSPLEPHEGEGRHVFVDFYRKIFVDKANEIQIMGSGKQVRCFIWVEDAAECIVDHLDDPRTDNQTFNLTRNEPKTLLELMEALIAIGKQKNILDKGYAPKISVGKAFAGVDSEKRVPSMKKLASTLGWESKTSFHDCFSKFIDHKEKP